MYPSYLIRNYTNAAPLGYYFYLDCKSDFAVKNYTQLVWTRATQRTNAENVYPGVYGIRVWDMNGKVVEEIGNPPAQKKPLNYRHGK